MISTVKKFPWHRTDLITVKETHHIYDAFAKLLMLLKHAIANRRSEDLLTKALFKRLLESGMKCPGFSVEMKDRIAYGAVVSVEDSFDRYKNPKMAMFWGPIWTLSPKANVPEDVLDFYVSVIRGESLRMVDEMSIKDQTAIQRKSALCDSSRGYFGHLRHWFELVCPLRAEKSRAWDALTMQEIYDHEMSAIEIILQSACT